MSWALLALAVLISVWGSSHGVASAQGVPIFPSADEWTRLGSFGPGTIEIVNLSPNWPDEPVIVVDWRGMNEARTRQERRIKVTFDGGRTWHSTDESLSFFPGVRPYFGGPDVVFMEQRVSQGTSRPDALLLHRWFSGGSWETVFTDGRQFHPSPLVHEDGVAFMVTEGALHRTADWGATWTEVLSGLSTVRTPEGFITASFAELALNESLYRQGMVLLASAGRIYHSPDRGISWHLAHAGRPEIKFFERYTSTDSVGPLFASDERSTIRLVSTDLGASWRAVPEAIGVLARSRSFATDNTYLATTFDGLGLLRSVDRGLTWKEISFPITTEHRAPGRTTWAVRFSPTFAVDRTVVAFFDNDANAVSGQAKAPSGFISRDGGETWGPLAPALVGDGQSYASVKEVTYSPEFERDGTLFARVVGPEAAGGPCAALLGPAGSPRSFMALFRSRDRGRTWQQVLSEKDLCAAADFGSMQTPISLWLSPAQVPGGGAGVLTWFASSYGSSRGGACFMLLTSDGGTSWRPERVGGPDACWALARPAPLPTATPPPQLSVIVVGTYEDKTSERLYITRSTPVGWRPWEPLRAPGDEPNFGTEMVFSPRFESDESLVVGTDMGEVWLARLCPCA